MTATVMSVPAQEPGQLQACKRISVHSIYGIGLDAWGCCVSIALQLWISLLIRPEMSLRRVHTILVDLKAQDSVAPSSRFVG